VAVPEKWLARPGTTVERMQNNCIILRISEKFSGFYGQFGNPNANFFRILEHYSQNRNEMHI